MNRRVVAAALLAAIVALLPVLYLYWLWPTVLALVPMHFDGSGLPNRFVAKIWLWNVVWYPAIAFVVLTFLPQVHEGQSLFWSSARQRTTRLLIVGALALDIAVLVRTSAQASRNSLALPPRRAARAAGR